MTEFPKAARVWLKKTNPMAPPFHRHIARSRLMGRICAEGDRVVVFEVVRTDPEGRVEVTADTVLHFE
jgi:hypothetical protein